MTDAAKISAVILAGGKSRRFGRPKGLELIDGVPIVQKLIDEIRAIGIDEIYISSDNPELFGCFGYPIVPDRYKNSGPLAGIHAVLETIKNDWLLVLSCDLPKITRNEIGVLLEHIPQASVPIIFAATNFSEHPLCSLINKEILKILERNLLENDHSVLEFFHGNKNRIFHFDDETPFLNLNTPDDFKINSAEAVDENLASLISVTRYNSGEKLHQIDDWVVREAVIRLWLNGNEVANIHAIAKEAEELALGFLYTECFINDPSMIESVEYNEKLFSVMVNTSEKIATTRGELVRSISSGCGEVRFSISPSYKSHFKRLETDYSIKADNIPVLMRHLMKASALFQSTGGVHACALSDGVDFLHFSDDIGRHNCVDKIIGRELKENKIQTAKRVLLTSGRVSTDIVLKAVRGQIPFIISHSAPVLGAIHVASDMGITLIGFARGARFNIYTNKERIIQ